MPPPLLALLLLCGAACAARSADQPVVLQLNYFHQFQFAGFYAADIQGYYQDEGLSVDMRELAPGTQSWGSLFRNEAHFAIAGRNICHLWGQGSDLFLVALIQQRNPLVLLVHEGSPYRSLGDIVDLPTERLVAPVTGIDESELLAGLAAIGRQYATVFPRAKQPGDFDRFVAGQIDVLPGYLTNEPFRLRRMGIPTRALALHPRRTIFPGDGIVCRGELWRTDPDLVERFRRASLRGWAFALDHPDIIIDHILAQRPSRHHTVSRDSLHDEAEAMRTLIEADIFPLGSINEQRLEHMATVLRQSGMPALMPQKQVYRAPRFHDRWFPLLVVGLLISGGAFVLLAVFTNSQQQSLAESQEHYRHLIELADGYFAFRVRLDQDGMHPELASPSIEVVLGSPLAQYQAQPGRFLDQLPARDRRRLELAARRTLLQGRPIHMRLTLQHPQAGPRHLMIHALPSRPNRGLVLDGICLDVTTETDAETERLQLHRQVERAQRHESLALLAGGVAHDFNNLLGAIRGYAELLRPPMSEEAPQRRWERLMSAVDRAAGLVRQILAYTGESSLEPKPLDLAKDLRQLVPLLQHGLPDGINIDLIIEPDLPAALFDAVQFQQVVMNLVVNAAESYEGKPGMVRVELRHHGRGQVRLTVTDNGCGMDEATHARMFEPYFTTKPTGHGLGLAAVQGAIHKAGGSLSCRSTIGLGTTFTIILAACEQRPTTGRIAASTPPPSGRQPVLVVDDDPLMREATADMLTSLGYQVVEATGGADAMLAVEKQPIGAVVMDCRMPERDGVTVLHDLRRRHQRLPVLLISGMTKAADIDSVLGDPRVRFLAKPFTLAQLAQTLDGLLGGMRAGDSDFTAVDQYLRGRQWTDGG